MHPPEELYLGTDNPQETRKMLVPSEQFCFARLSAHLRHKTESQKSLRLFALHKHQESLCFPHLWCDRSFAYPASNPQKTGNHPSKLLQLQGTQPPGRSQRSQETSASTGLLGKSLGRALISSSDLQRKGPQMFLLSTESSPKDRNRSLTTFYQPRAFALSWTSPKPLSAPDVVAWVSLVPQVINPVLPSHALQPSYL